MQTNGHTPGIRDYRQRRTCEKAKGIYALGRSLGYNYTTLLKTLQWGKDNTREVIDVNIPRKYMKVVVLLFT